MPDITDMFGKVLKIGDTIAYPSRRSSSLWMIVAVIEDIKTKTRRWKSDEYTYLVTRKMPVGPMGRWHNSRRGVVLSFYNIIKLENYNERSPNDSNT